jgi:nitrite reductase/ring-hydroxylating ferredoxin subunit
MQQSATPLCSSSALEDGGAGVRITLAYPGRIEPAFVLRFNGMVRAYLNRCAHKHVELDWEAGQFLDTDRHFIVCATHGALYDPANGQCVAGPCRGGGLVPIAVREEGGMVWLAEPAASVVK